MTRLPRLRLARASRLLAWAAIALFAVFIAVQAWFLIQVIWYRTQDPVTSSVMREQLEKLSGENPRFRLAHQWVPYDRIANNLKRAVIASEDSRFAVHEGVDWNAIEQAWDDNLRKGRVVRGGSTITMQLAKNLFLSGERSYLRKGQELLISYMLETVLDKRRILELYLNIAEWGVGVFGAQAAAMHYYGLDASQLSSQQAARLAVMLPQPRFYDRNRQSDYLERRTDIIERRMRLISLP